MLVSVALIFSSLYVPTSFSRCRAMVKKAAVPQRQLSRGGARNSPKARVETERLSDALKNHVEEVGAANAFHFHEYESAWSSCAIRFQSLAKLVPFLMAILGACPTANLSYSQLKEVFMTVFTSIPACKPKSGPLSTLAGDVADRTIVVLNHVRRLCLGGSCEKEWRKCEETLCGLPDKLGQLKDLRARVRQAAGAEQSEAGGSEGRIAALQKYQDVPLSQDSDGLPRWSFLPNKKSKEGDQEEDAVEDVEAMAAQAAMKKPAAASVQAAATKPRILRKPSAAIGKQKPLSLDTVLNVPGLSLKGPFKEKSYILNEGGQLIVACTTTQSPNFHAVLQSVMAKLRKTKDKGKLTKSYAVKLRDEEIAME